MAFTWACAFTSCKDVSISCLNCYCLPLLVNRTSKIMSHSIKRANYQVTFFLTYSSKKTGFLPLSTTKLYKYQQITVTNQRRQLLVQVTLTPVDKQLLKPNILISTVLTIIPPTIPNTHYFWILLTMANRTARTSADEQVHMDL